jgi:hypothetical protein
MKGYFWIGVVEDRMDPLYLGRCRVRIFGVHTSDTFELPTEDLPWAVAVTPSSNASMTGVGSAPVGPVEGTTVVGFFLDYPDTQAPAFMGAISGIPQQEQITDDVNALVIAYDKIDDEPKYLNPLENEFEPEESPFDALSPFQMVCSDDGIEMIKRQVRLITRAEWDGTQWVLGYNQPIIGGRQVVQDQRISGIEAEVSLRQFVTNNIEPRVREKVRVDITQAMFDIFCVLEYRTDYDPKICTLINQRKFKEVSLILGTMDKKFVEMFESQGIPKPDGSTNLSKVPYVDISQSSAGIITGRNSDPTPVHNYFGQAPVAWPRQLMLNEPDTNRLARHHNIRRTIVYQKETEVEEGIKIANMDISWRHSDVPYNARYPYNKVMETESGHVIEIDDTPGCERINVHHKSGTFIEVDANGTRVARTKGDVYEIMERNGFVHIKGHVVVNVEGNANFTVQGNADVNASNIYATAENDIKVEAKGGMDITLAKDLQINAAGIKMRATEGNVDFTFPSGNFNADGRQVWLNGGKATGTKIESITDSRTDFDKMVDELRALEVQTRVDEELTLIEFPEEDEAAARHRQDLIKRGLEPPTAFADVPIIRGAEAMPVPNSAVVVEPHLESKNNVSTLRLSKYFTLADLTASSTISNRQNPVIAVHRLSVDQIIQNLSRLATNCLDPIYEEYKFNITSGLRWPSNRYSIPSSISRHEIGLAADLMFPGKSKQEVIQICRWISQSIPYDTILLEYSARTGSYWIHVQLTDGPLRVRNMTAIQRGNRTQIVSSNSFVVVNV